MQFNHDNMSGVRVAEALVNMLDGGGWEERALGDLLAGHLFHNPQVGAKEEALLREWTIRLRTVFALDSEEGRCGTVNALLEQGVKRVFLTVHDGLGPHLHFAETSDSLVERVRALTAGGLALFITEAAGGRLGTCARDGCPRVFADTSRGGRRAYCSARCGNADAVMRYRGRGRGHPAGRL
ncbi:CGNR zinc finger domain-containing protein [Arthrobacter sp. SAFR-044]|uniref:CGNR zinc finger domain-containing protein n=1 Tax=Arthrobacter sp. SAFR-044 TaxID=3387278 RepID=UPI003F7B9540